MVPGSTSTSANRSSSMLRDSSESKLAGVGRSAAASSGESKRLGAATAIRPPARARDVPRQVPGRVPGGGRGHRAARQSRRTGRGRAAPWPPRGLGSGRPDEHLQRAVHADPRTFRQVPCQLALAAADVEDPRQALGEQATGPGRARPRRSLAAGIARARRKRSGSRSESVGPAGALARSPPSPLRLEHHVAGRADLAGSTAARRRPAHRRRNQSGRATRPGAGGTR